MSRYPSCCLLVNPASGSNAAQAVEDVKSALNGNSVAVSRVVTFPDEPVPSAQDLDREGIPLLVIFTGDGSANAAISALSGWGGAILVLPGGTMNLLAKRLHADLSIDDIIAIVAGGGALARRINCAQSRHGIALAGLLAGPGTAWGNVREAMRDLDLAGMAQGAVEAMSETTGGARVTMASPGIGREDGYPLIEINPGEHGLQIAGFYADNAGEYAKQGWALLRRQFRQGPHDRLGMAESMTISSCDGSDIGLLLDGEAYSGGPSETFTVAPCGVDLLATAHAD